METGRGETRLFRIGVYELSAETGELRKDAKLQSRLQAQPLQVLLMLLDRPREVVTREELRQAIWPANTFVDFDHGLNTAINKLRGAFGDSAANPRFIQTLPRIGYRFIAPVEVPHGAPAVAADAAAPATISSEAPSALRVGIGAIFSAADDLPRASHGLTRLLFAVIQAMYLGFYVAALACFGDAQASIASFTTHAGVASVVLILTAAAGIPLRLYLVSAAAFRYRNLGRSFLKLFPLVFPLDEIWALAPFLISRQIGMGLALGATAALLYVPFAQRSLLLMRPREAAGKRASGESA
ncbi:MAG TPA: winged helix-turn-helix domain-containing protein [Candidatus Acidoferrales bacterium]|nr:winged helix-turn-helix domain-containing protein [Candidatus Acidoferrales bacterium]